APGINGKMNEIIAAFGLVQIKHVDKALRRRKEVEMKYRAAFSAKEGLSLLPIPSDTITNAAYMPLLVDQNFPLSRDQLYDKLKAEGINCRRYFHPLISNLPMYRG